MSVVVQNPTPKPRRRIPKPIESNIQEHSAGNIELNDAKVLDELRQSIEKTGDSGVMKNNLFQHEVPDKMEKRRRHRKIEKNVGEDNPSFEPDSDVKLHINENVESREEQPHRRRRRRTEKPILMETNNEELSSRKPVDEENEEEQQDDEVKSRRRRRRAKQKSKKNDDTEEANRIRDPMMIEDDDRVLNIMIHRTDRLKTDLNILHPMIRVHIIDITTGRFLMKQHRDRKVTSYNEDTEKVTMVLPIVTQPFDFKSRRVTIPAWEESLVFNENSNYLIKNQNVIYFFEILDINQAYSVDKSYPIQQEASGFHHIAWAFLRPTRSVGGYNTDHKVRLQLYENGPLRPGGDPFSPNVFSWWKQGFRQTYPSTLYVTVAAIKLNPEISTKFAMRSMFPNQQEGAPSGLIDSHLPGLNFNNHHTSSALQPWMRLPSQMCHIPNVPQVKLTSSTDGANVLAFSPDGTWLACGAVENMDNFPILLYDMNTLGNHASHTFLGHNRIVHSIAWCHKSEFVASASADGTCKIWRIKVKVTSQENGNATGEDTQNSQSAPITDTNVFGDKRTLSHPCFVYSVAFHPRLNTILITAGYDKIVRVWDLTFNRKEVLHKLDGHKGFINCVLFSHDGRSMYSGDAKGEIHVWDVPQFELNNQSIFSDKWKRHDVLAERNLQGVIINNLVLHPNGKRLFVHSRDGGIRLIDLKMKSMVLKFAGIANSEKNLRCTLTPCGSFLFCGSEDASVGSQIFVWNAQTGDNVAVYKELGLSEPVTSIAYHPKCHLIAFTALGNESSIIIYTYSSEQAQMEMGYHSGNSNPGSPRRQMKRQVTNYDNMTKLDDLSLRTRSFENEEKDFNSFKDNLEKKNIDRISRILSTLNSVTEVDRSFRSANRSMDRNLNSSRNSTLNDGYASGPEEKGKFMRSNVKTSTLQSIPMTLSMTSSTKANFTFKPPPYSKKKEQSNIYLGEVVALFDYQAQRSDEISFARGEVIKIVFRDGKNWLLGETNDGRQGYLPSNYVAGEELIPHVSEISEEQNNNSTPSKRSNARTDNLYDATVSSNASQRSSRNEKARHRRRLDSTNKETL